MFTEIEFIDTQTQLIDSISTGYLVVPINMWNGNSDQGIEFRITSLDDQSNLTTDDIIKITDLVTDVAPLTLVVISERPLLIRIDK